MTLCRARRPAAESHDMAHGDHHYSGVLAVDRPDLVEWKPLNPKDLEMGDITIDYINSLDGPRTRWRSPPPRRRPPGSRTS